MSYETRASGRREARPAPDAAPEEPGRGPGRRGRGLWLLAAAGLAAAAFVGWVAWTALDDDEGGGVGVEEIVDDPDAFVGRTVTVRGEVSAVLGPDAVFIGGETLGGDGGFPGGRSLLVIAEGLGAATADDEEAVVEATGEVRVLDADTLERRFAVEEEFFDDEFETPAVVASEAGVTGG